MGNTSPEHDFIKTGNSQARGQACGNTLPPTISALNPVLLAFCEEGFWTRHTGMYYVLMLQERGHICLLFSIFLEGGWQDKYISFLLLLELITTNSVA